MPVNVSEALAAVLREQLRPTDYSVRWDGAFCHIQRRGRTVHWEISVTLAAHWIERQMTPGERVRTGSARHGKRSFG